jgi:hypothetical protein
VNAQSFCDRKLTGGNKYRPVSLDMPEEWIAKLPTDEEIWDIGSKTPHGWKMSTNMNTNPPKFVHRHYDILDVPECPDIFHTIAKELEAPECSMFACLGDGTNGTLDWHMDGYFVYAFNIEGTTEWEWFDLGEGEKMRIRIEPKKNMIMMPAFVTHQVHLLSETRVSVSFVRTARLNDAGGQA